MLNFGAFSKNSHRSCALSTIKIIVVIEITDTQKLERKTLPCEPCKQRLAGQCKGLLCYKVQNDTFLAQNKKASVAEALY